MCVYLYYMNHFTTGLIKSDVTDICWNLHKKKAAKKYTKWLSEQNKDWVHVACREDDLWQIPQFETLINGKSKRIPNQIIFFYT